MAVAVEVEEALRRFAQWKDDQMPYSDAKTAVSGFMAVLLEEEVMAVLDEVRDGLNTIRSKAWNLKEEGGDVADIQLLSEKLKTAIEGVQ